jgi:septal ring factor EnvC (AmiA/AmiB activator)
MPSVQTHFRPTGRRFAAALTVLAVSLGIALASGPSTNAQSQQLDAVRAEQDQIRAELAKQNAAVDALIGQVSALRQREEAVAAELAEQEAKLTAARTELADARDALAQTKRRLHGALADLRRLLVSVYRYGQIDTVSVLLDSDGFDELTTTYGYLERIRDYESRVVGRVRDLRNAASQHVDEVEGAIARIKSARAAIAARQQALAASRASLEQREAELQTAQADRRDQLAMLQGKEKSLVRALAAPPPPPASGGGETTAPAPAENVAPPNGSQATLNSDGTATAPAGAPEAVQATIAAANAISDTPYVWGGGHGSFESAGYDCSGSVSYALHGGGFLSSPLDSTGFMTWGEGGPGNWITVYSNPGHAYMVVAGLRFDTSGGAGPRWQTEPRDPAGFVATHPPGY